jgi:hypothetical protein
MRAVAVSGLVVPGLRELRWRRGSASGLGDDLLEEPGCAPRLHCVESNERLRDYYREQGFTEVGRQDWTAGG